MAHQKILTLFDQQNIPYQLHEHKPFFTCDEASELKISGANTKNLFLKDEKKNFFLVSVAYGKRVNLKELSKPYAKKGRFSFGNEEQLKELLGLTPGSVTPLGLINDTENKVTFLIDKDLLEDVAINCHPLRNDMTVSITPQDFLRFCKVMQHEPTIIEVPCLPSE